MKDKELSMKELDAIVGGGSGGGQQITCGVACALCASCGNLPPNARARKARRKK